MNKQQDVRNAIAAAGYPGGVSAPHALRIVGPEIRMIFVPTPGNPVNITLGGNTGAARTADPNLNTWMPADQKYLILWKSLRFELFPSGPTYGDDAEELVLAGAALAMRHAPSGGLQPYYYGGPGHSGLGTAAPRTVNPTATDVRDVSEYRIQPFKPLTTSLIDVAADEWTLESVPGFNWPAAGGILHVVMEGLAIRRDRIVETEPSLAEGALLEALDDSYRAPLMALTGWKRLLRDGTLGIGNQG